jgi:glycosyltransferase involved in cell wall biosynthesis
MSPMTHDQAVCGRILDRSQILTAAVVYDFIPADVPERYLAASSSLQEYAAALLWLEAYDCFAPISAYAETRLIELVDADADSHVTGVTLREEFQTLHANRKTNSGVGRSNTSQKPSHPYFLFVGGGDPRKNIDLVLDAHASLNVQGIHVDLVVVGSYCDDARTAHAHRYESMKGNSGNIRYKRDISDSELASLYSNALATICSSHIEGFSLPVIEAIACGSPVLVSDCEAHCELITESISRFSSTDVSALNALMQRVAKDSDFRPHLLESQDEVPLRFYRSEVAKQFWQPLLDRYEAQFGSAENSGYWYHNSSSLPSLAILSPYPPDQSGVADYTKRTIDALVGKATVDMFTDVERPHHCDNVQQFFKIDDWAYLSGKYDRVLSVVGNSHFHIKIMELQQAFGGPCLIHDNRLADIFRVWKGPEYFRRLACKTVNREVSLEEAESWLQDPSKLPGIFFDDLIESSTPLIVHSRGIQRQVLKQYGVHAEYLPFSCYRTFDESELIPEVRKDVRRRLGMKENELHIVTLGIVHSSKAPDRCLEAIALMRRKQVHAHLHFVGSYDPAYRKSLESIANDLNILDLVHFSSDWVTDSLYRDYVIAADYAIQLRTHFFGGLSGAMLDCICAGLPTVCNANLAEALEGPETVLRVSDNMLSSEVSSVLLDSIAQEHHLDRLVRCRQKYIEDHSFDRYSDALLDVLKVSRSQSVMKTRNHAA